MINHVRSSVILRIFGFLSICAVPLALDVILRDTVSFGSVICLS